MTVSPASKLWTPDSYNYKKSDPPKLGDKYGGWLAGREESIQYAKLPGGGIMQFDLDRLTLDDYRAMRNHYQVNISLSILGFMMHQIDWRIACDDKKIRDAVELWMAEIWTRLIHSFAQSFWAGYSPMILQWDNHPTEPRIILDKVLDLVPEDCRVNWKQVDGYAPVGHVPEKIFIYDGIKVRNKSYPVPAESSLWYPLLMENGDHYGRKLLKPAFPAWFFSQLIHLFSNRYFERFGEPLPIGRAPFDEPVDMGDGTTKSGREVMDGILRNIRNRSAVVLPNNLQSGNANHQGKPSYDYEIEYLESQMRGADFERYLTRLDEEISLGIFTPVLLYRTSDVGSYNLGEAHFRLFMSLLNALAGDIKRYLDEYVLERLVNFNFGPNAPRAKWIPRKMGKDNPETLRAIISAMISGGVAKVDVHDLGTALGLQVEEVELMVEAPTLPGDDPNAKPGDPGTKAVKPGDGSGTGASGSTVKKKPSDNTVQLLNRMLFRCEGQAKRLYADGQVKNLDFGYERQLADLLPGGRTDAQDVLARANRWAVEAMPLFDNAETFVVGLGRVLNGLVDELV